MSVLMQAARPQRLRQFARVMRSEGAGVAVARARTHLRLMAAGQVPGESAALPATAPGPRFAFSGQWADLARSGGFHAAAAPGVLRRRRKVAMIGDLNLPQCRKYRVEQLDELFAVRDISYGFAHYEDLPRCRELMQTATHLMLYRLARSDLATMYLYEARRLRLPVLYDIDDPLFSVSAYETYGNMGCLDPALKAHFLSEAPLYLDVLNAADAVSVSTPGLADHARNYTGRDVFLRRNFADRVTLDAGRSAIEAGRRRDDRVTLAVASGSRGHEADLAGAIGAIGDFLAASRDHRLVVLGHLATEALPDGVLGQVERVPFTDYPDYLSALAVADAAIAPLADDSFNRCKSAVRVLDAAAVGVASMVSPVGDLAAPMGEDETGLVVTDWRAALERLARDPAGMCAMGARARVRLERDWTARAGDPVAGPGFFDWVMG